MDFSTALCEVKKGNKIYRSGWNGANMYIVYKKGYTSIPCNKDHARAHNLPVGTPIVYRDYLEMKTAQGDYVPWVASQTDLLADDWDIKHED